MHGAGIGDGVSPERQEDSYHLNKGWVLPKGRLQEGLQELQKSGMQEEWLQNSRLQEELQSGKLQGQAGLLQERFRLQECFR